jgi:hypothetical protein
MAAVAPSLPGSVSARARDLPATMIWAWERPEDLRWLDEDTGIAFLAQTLTFDARGMRIAPRRQPLRVDDAARLVAVTRIEMPGAAPADEPAIEHAVETIAATASLPRVVGVQLDFDATVSQRQWYAALLRAVRDRLPSSMALSMTALASWCVGDRWIEDLPVDEVVPMLFDLGPFNEPYSAIAVQPSAGARECRAAVGLSVNDARPAERRGRRVYLFNARPWTREAFESAKKGGGL